VEINSKEYWDNRFRTNWIEFNGKEQTKNFMELIVQNLPNFVDLNGKKILDWGCALGQGVEVLMRHFPTSFVCGLDISDQAIFECRQVHPELFFYNGFLKDYRINYDVIITSNCLQLFKNPYFWINEMMEYTREFLIILVPYNDSSCENEDSEHKFKFLEESFPNRINNFSKIYTKIINQCPGCWSNKQLLVIFERKVNHPFCWF